MCEELGYSFHAPRVGSDSNAARGVTARHGLGKLKHMELKYLWLQGAIRDRRLVVVREDGDRNFADLMTKHLDGVRMLMLLEAAGFEYREGRAPGAPRLAEGAVQQRIAVILGVALLGMGLA